MIIIKWILLIAMIKYSYGLKTKAPRTTTISTTTTIHEVPTKCGILNPNGVGKTLLGTEDHQAQFGEFPWMVAVLKKIIIKNTTYDVYHCGGSLIHPSVVLTTGSKVFEEDPASLNVRAGEWDTQTTEEPFPFVESQIASIKIHDNFEKGTGIYFIALLFLKTSIENAQHISTICLPPPDTIFDGANCFVTGWGKDKFKKGKYQAILKKIELSVIERQKCQEMFRKAPKLGESFVFHESFICAGGEEGKNACTGDGGSPLVCPVPGHKEHYYQAGIVAWGVECGEANVPSAYTNVAFFGGWIEEQIKNIGYNASSYTI